MTILIKKVVYTNRHISPANMKKHELQRTFALQRKIKVSVKIKGLCNS